MNNNFKKLLVAGLACAAVCTTTLAAPHGGRNGQAPRPTATRNTPQAKSSHAPQRTPKRAARSKGAEHDVRTPRPGTAQYAATNYSTAQGCPKSTTESAWWQAACAPHASAAAEGPQALR